MRVSISKSEFVDDVPPLESEKEKLRLIHEGGPKFTKRLQGMFQDDDVQVIEMLQDGRGGGGSPLVEYLFLWVSVQVVLTLGKGFFDELGKELAKKLIKVLSKSPGPTRIWVSSRSDSKISSVSVTIPPDCSEEDMERILQFIENSLHEPGPFDKSVFYEKSGKTMVEWHFHE